MGTPGNPNWKHGVSGNPGGRRLGAIAALSREIAEATHNGADLVGLLLGFANDPGRDDEIRLEATKILLDRMAGRPVASLVSATIGDQEALPEQGSKVIDLDRLSDEQRNAILDLYRHGELPTLGDPETVDVAPVAAPYLGLPENRPAPLAPLGHSLTCACHLCKI